MSNKIRIVTKKVPIISTKEIYEGYWNIDGKTKDVLGCYVFARLNNFVDTKRLGRIVLKHSLEPNHFQEIVYNGLLTENGVTRQNNIFFAPFEFRLQGQQIEYYYENYLTGNYDLILMLKVIQQI